MSRVGRGRLSFALKEVTAFILEEWEGFEDGHFEDDFPKWVTLIYYLFCTVLSFGVWFLLFYAVTYGFHPPLSPAIVIALKGGLVLLVCHLISPSVVIIVV